jgi:hypothetical protein
MTMKNTVKGSIAALGIVGAMATGIGIASSAHASSNCQTVQWGFLGTARRTICDTPRGPDGGWMRHRTVWRSGRYVPPHCSGYYYLYCYDGYYSGDNIMADETYPVNDAIVLPDEPGHLG